MCALVLWFGGCVVLAGLDGRMHFGADSRVCFCVLWFGGRACFYVRRVINRFAGVAQLARALAFQAKGCGFDPRLPLT